MNNKEIIIGSDHTGIELVNEIYDYLVEKGYDVEIIKNNSETDDYPDIAENIAKEVIKKSALGIAICGTGIGISIACNKVNGIRASVCYDEYTTEMARKHNDLNILCLGARTVTAKNYRKLVDIFLNTNFEGGRHVNRINKISNIEKKEGRI